MLYDILDERVFRNKSRGLLTLDEIEGEGGAYQRVGIRVVDTTSPGTVMKVLTYVVKSPEAGLTTGLDYAQHIL